MFISRGTTKSRPVPGPVFFIDYWGRSGSPSNSWTKIYTATRPTNGTQITESDGNWWPLPKGSAIADSGSEFFTRKTEVLTSRYPHSELYFKDPPGGGYNDYRIRGNFYLANAFGNQSLLNANSTTGKDLVPSFPDLSSSRTALEQKGTIAVAACNPGNQIANAASAVGELLDKVPSIPGVSLWKSRLRALETLAASGDEFLNVVFGISPTVSDIRGFLEATHKVDKAVDQFVRDSGRTVRRSYYFPKERTETITDRVTKTGSPSVYIHSPIGVGDAGGANALYPQIGLALPRYYTTRHRVVEREIWFSGAFTYHIPDWYETGNRGDRMRLTAQLLGGKPDLNTLWQLTPWSWAVDWFSNAGSFVKSLQSLINYGTVLRYGYVMETTTVTDTYSAGEIRFQPELPYMNWFTTRPYPAVAPVRLRVTTKKRIQANPFGFGLSWDGLSTTQQAIVAALGITRVVR